MQTVSLEQARMEKRAIGHAEACRDRYHEAQRCYGIYQYRSRGALPDEVEHDLKSFEEIATQIVNLAVASMKAHKSTNDRFEGTPLSLKNLATQLHEVMTEGLGMSRQATEVIERGVAAMVATILAGQ